MHMKVPFIGVCTTNYNCGFVLKKHVKSVYDALEGLRFEYVIVDNYSKDDSWEILKNLSEEHENLVTLREKCKRGEGRNIAYRHSQAEYILCVDSDTIYSDKLRCFLLAYFSRPDLINTAVKAGSLQGIYPRHILDAVGGWGNLNCDDWDLTVRIWKKGLDIKIYPVSLGENIKEEWASSDFDFLSDRYGRMEKLMRWANVEIEKLGMNGRWHIDMNDVYRDLYINMGLGEPLHIERYKNNLNEYEHIGSYLHLLRSKITLAIGIEEILNRWSEDRRNRDRKLP